MTKSSLPKSVRKFIRLEKSRIRAQFFDIKKQEEAISQLYNKFSKRPTLEKQNMIKDVKEVKVPMPANKQEKSTAKSLSKKSKVTEKVNTK